jgi:hypothetical protein
MHGGQLRQGPIDRRYPIDIGWLIVIAHALMIVGAAVLFGLIRMARPVAAIGLDSRTRAGLVVLAGLCIASGGIVLLDFHRHPTTPCGHGRSPVTAVQSCLQPL